MSDPPVLQDTEKKRYCSLCYSVHLKIFWRGFPLLLTTIQLYQSKPEGFQPCFLIAAGHVACPWLLHPALYSMRTGAWDVDATTRERLQQSQESKEEWSTSCISVASDPGYWSGFRSHRLPALYLRPALYPLMSSTTFLELHHPFLLLLSHISPCYIQKLPQWISQSEQPSQSSQHESLVRLTATKGNPEWTTTAMVFAMHLPKVVGVASTKLQHQQPLKYWLLRGLKCRPQQLEENQSRNSWQGWGVHDKNHLPAMFQPHAATFKEAGSHSGDVLLSHMKVELKERLLAGCMQHTDVGLAVDL